MARPRRTATQKKRRKQVRPRTQRNFGGRLPEYLPRATEFTDDPVLGNPDWVVATLLAYRRQLPLIDRLVERTTVRHDDGRPRFNDKPALVAAAYVASREPSMEDFWRSTARAAPGSSPASSAPARATADSSIGLRAARSTTG